MAQYTGGTITVASGGGKVKLTVNHGTSHPTQPTTPSCTLKTSCSEAWISNANTEKQANEMYLDVAKNTGPTRSATVYCTGTTSSSPDYVGTDSWTRSFTIRQENGEEPTRSVNIGGFFFQVISKIAPFGWSRDTYCTISCCGQTSDTVHILTNRDDKTETIPGFTVTGVSTAMTYLTLTYSITIEGAADAYTVGVAAPLTASVNKTFSPTSGITMDANIRIPEGAEDYPYKPTLDGSDGLIRMEFLGGPGF